MTDSRGTSVIEGAMARWSSPLESILFGTQDPDEVEDLLREYCSRHLGRRLEEVLFYERGVGAVFGIRIDDGNDVVVKVHRPDIGQGLDVVVQVQRHLSTLGVPAPRPLAAPAPLALGIATTEGLLDRGRVGNAHDPLVRRVLTRGLFEFVEAATPLASSVRALPGHLFNSPDDSLWPIPHDARFDLSAPGGEWIDDVAAQAKRRLRLPHGRRVVGHEDWRVENLRVDGDRIVAIFDWDSLVLAHEPVLVGQNSTSFTADWANPDVEPYPSLDESTAFVDDYEAARGYPFTEAECETADASHLYALAYNARCEHSDTVLGVFADAGLKNGWRGLLRDRLSSPLL